MNITINISGPQESAQPRAQQERRGRVASSRRAPKDSHTLFELAGWLGKMIFWQGLHFLTTRGS